MLSSDNIRIQQQLLGGVFEFMRSLYMNGDIRGKQDIANNLKNGKKCI